MDRTDWLGEAAAGGLVVGGLLAGFGVVADQGSLLLAGIALMALAAGLGASE